MDETNYLAELTSGQRYLGIIGQGYVGLPLAEAFARVGIYVKGFDISAEKVEQINRGESYIDDVSSESIKDLVAAGTLQATTDFSELASCGAIIVCVPTPLSKTKEPDVSFIEAAINEIIPQMQPGQLIVLESTTYPGTTEELMLPQLELGGLNVGQDFFLAFSPERVDPGNPKYGVANTPKIIGGVTPECTKRAVALYSQAIDGVHPVSSTTTAEMVKLLENTFRAINIGFVNELANMCRHLDVDVWEVIEAAKTKPFGFMPFYPGPGLGGHCIPIDPLYLSWKLRRLDYKAQFIDLADTINASMPSYTVARAMDQLNDSGLPMKNSRILVLGIAYKEDITDMRESPALDVITKLHEKGALVSYHDPYVSECILADFTLRSEPLSAEVIQAADLVMIVTGHNCIDYQQVVEQAERVFDAKNATGSRGIISPKIRRL